MRIWRTWTIILLVLALPVTSIANIIDVYCTDNSEPTTIQIELASTDHCDNSDDLNVASNSSLPADCPCDCKDTVGCLSASTNVFALSIYTKPAINLSTSQLSIDQVNQFDSFQSPPLIRPPITFS